MAGRIARSSIDGVRERADIVELISARTGPVRRTGARAMARCPFHDERTPSCSVDPAAKLYHCFGCGESGDVFTLIMKLEGLSFDEAVESLADRYGIELEREDVSPREAAERDRGRRLDQLLEDACAWYQRMLAESEEAAAARAYLDERGIDLEERARYRLGFAPDAWERLVGAARRKGYRDEELLAAGIASEGRRGPIDRFRGRVIFPLADARGRVRGFAGRVLPGGEGAKYVNSPETEVFKKSRIVYGLHLARASIARSGRALVVEGYTDVMALHGAGHPEAVAAMGTSLTEEQLRELRRLAPEVVLCFDADAAGQEAALRGMRIAEDGGLRVRVVALPAGLDPADLARQGGGALEAALGAAESVTSFRIGRILARLDADGADAAYRRAQTVLAELPPSPERLEQVRRVVDALRLDDDLAQRLARARPRLAGAAADGDGLDARARRRLHADRQRERELLGACLGVPEAGRRLLADGLAADALEVAEHRAILPWLAARIEGDDVAPPEGLAPVAAEIVAIAGRYAQDRDVPASQGRDPIAESRWAVQELWLRHRLDQVARRISTLKGRLASDDYSPEDERELTRLQRESKTIEERIRGGA